VAWLDRERTPVRFAVVTSVASGVILTAILRIFQIAAPKFYTFAWLTLACGGVAMVSWVTLSTIRHVRKRSKRAFLMTSAFSQKYYVAAFAQRLHSAFDRDDIDLVIKVPDRDYDASAQSHHLDRLLARRHDCMAGSSWLPRCTDSAMT
jgi:ribose transport system substrate-binding protein